MGLGKKLGTSIAKGAGSNIGNNTNPPYNARINADGSYRLDSNVEYILDRIY